MKETDPFYNSVKWKTKREKILRRDNYKCQLSWRYGKNVEADTVHHIFPREDYPQYEWEDWNLISLSREMHDRLHDRVTGALTREGQDLLAATAKKRGISIEPKHRCRLTLVVGAPGSGKTTYVQHHMTDGLCYDLDHIAAAFRLRAPHDEFHEEARRMANDLLMGWVDNVDEYTHEVYVIRTRPTEEEISVINPDLIVLCTGSHDITDRADYIRGLNITVDAEKLRRYCDRNHIALKVIED